MRRCRLNESGNGNPSRNRSGNRFSRGLDVIEMAAPRICIPNRRARRAPLPSNQLDGLYRIARSCLERCSKTATTRATKGKFGQRLVPLDLVSSINLFIGQRGSFESKDRFSWKNLRIGKYWKRAEATRQWYSSFRTSFALFAMERSGKKRKRRFDRSQMVAAGRSGSLVRFRDSSHGAG